MEIYSVGLTPVPGVLRDTEEIRLRPRYFDYSEQLLATPEVQLSGNLDLTLGGFKFTVDVDSVITDNDELVKLLRAKNTSLTAKPHKPILNLKSLVEKLTRKDLSLYQKPNETLAKTLARYDWDERLSHALMKVLRRFELCLSDQLDSLFCELYGPNWLRKPPAELGISRRTRRKITAFVKQIRKKSKDSRDPTHAEILAEMSLGFWVAFFHKNYNKKLWHKHGRLAKIFPNMPFENLNQPDISKLLHRIKWLRNRIAHHKPIWQDISSVIDIHSCCKELLGAICTDALSDLESKDQVPKILKEFLNHQ